MQFLKYHLPLILYGLAILTVSSISNLRSPEVKFLASDKLAHFLEYALFAFLAYRSTRHWSGRLTVVSPFVSALLLLTCFAVIDEFLQAFIPGRHSAWEDYLADLAGGLAVLVILWWRNRKTG